MDLVHMATCSVRWGYILWSTESIKIRQNQEKDFGGFGVVWVKVKTSIQLYKMLRLFVNQDEVLTLL